MNIVLRFDYSSKNYVFGCSIVDDINSVENWQESTTIPIFENGIYYVFAKNIFNGQFFRAVHYVSCGEDSDCIIRIRRIKLKNKNTNCSISVKRLKILPKVNQGKAIRVIIGLIGETLPNQRNITEFNEENVCDLLLSSNLAFDDFYIDQNENIENGVLLFVDSARTNKVPVNKIYGVVINNRNYHFSTDILSRITSLTECVSSNLETFDVSGFFYTSYNDYDGNNATLKRIIDIRELHSAIGTGMFYGEVIVENIKSSGASGSTNVGDKLFDTNNVQITGNCFIGYYVNDEQKFIRISEGLIAEKGDLIIPSGITGTIPIFPYSTKNGSGDSGYGFLSHDGSWWKARLRLRPDQQTIDFVYNDGANGAEFTFNDGTYNYQVKPWFSIGRASKIFGIPNNYKIPDMFRGTWIELLGSCDVTTNRGLGENDDSYYTRIVNVETNFNYGFHILVGR